MNKWEKETTSEDTMECDDDFKTVLDYLDASARVRSNERQDKYTRTQQKCKWARTCMLGNEIAEP
jgi:hypothetical protein